MKAVRIKEFPKFIIFFVTKDWNVFNVLLLAN